MGRRRKKLATVARLYFSDPMKYGRSCRDCLLHVYDEDTGKPKLSRTSKYTLPMVRLKADTPPCHTCAKTIGLEERHWRFVSDPPKWCYKTFRHWLRGRAVNWQGVAVDRIVIINAALFESIEDCVIRGRNIGVLELLGLLRRR